MIRFVTLFEKTRNETLLKDVGMIPYFLNMDNEISAKIVTCRMSDEYYYLNKYLENLDLDIIPLYCNSIWLSGLIYLWKNSKNIDILNVYHLKTKIFIDYLIYKLRNRGGKVYLKLDIDYQAIRKKNGFIKGKLYSFFLRHVDYCSVESLCMAEEVEKKYGVRPNYISNGFYIFEQEECIEKQNIFLTVGRLGTKQKATEKLMYAFAKFANEHNWKLILIGSIEQEFEKNIEKFYLDYPELKERVIFKGPIADKKELLSYYKKSKVFVLPSRWESFGLVLLEALSEGCFLVGSDQIPPMNDLIDEGKYGTVFEFENDKELAEILKNLTQREYFISDIEKEIEFANRMFRWDNIIKRLAYDLKGICKND